MTAKARVVTVQGRRGKLVKAFKHAGVEIKVEKGKVYIEMWFGSYRNKAVVKSVASSIQNMIDGVTKGHKYKMKSVYAHFPITMSVLEGGKALEIRNFVGRPFLFLINILHRREADKEN